MTRELGLPGGPGLCPVSPARAIQRQRGETDCCDSDDHSRCTHVAREWRRDCLKPIAAWRR